MKKHLPDSTRGKMILDIDLNSLPAECYLLEGTSAAFDPYHTAGQQQESSARPTSIIDVEAIEDEGLAPSSSGGFPVEVTGSNPGNSLLQKSKGTHRTKGNRPVTVIVDDGLELNLSRSVITDEQVARSSFNAQKRPFISSASRKSIDCDSYIDLEEGHDPKRKISMTPEPNLLKGVVKPFTCPICMEELVEAASTICGHIFCMSCTKLSIRTQKKCPSCRRKLNMKNFHRVYLPN